MKKEAVENINFETYKWMRGKKRNIWIYY